MPPPMIATDVLREPPSGCRSGAGGASILYTLADMTDHHDIGVGVSRPNVALGFALLADGTLARVN